jgi:WD40 repeat protein/DNA-binding SARP family transcriptional activator
VDFRLLGPLEVIGDGGLAVSVGAGRQRALLALLILRANELVASDRLVEELWGESPPPTAHRMLHNQVSALRRALGPDGRLETQGSAYRLNVRPGERDVDRFEELVASGRAQIDADPEGAADRLRQALELWRGPALSDLSYERFAQSEIARLEERRWVAFEERVEAELALGRHADLVSELEAAVAEQPLREHLHAQLMLALYRCGRQAEALEAYRTARRTLVEAVGVEPGAELRALQDAILAQDPALDAPLGPEDLPAALEGGSPILAGRDRELAELTASLADACEGLGAVVLVGGPHGSGKTRLAAELAREALRRRMTVIYTAARSAQGDALAAIRRAKASERPVLLVVDDADDAGHEVLDCVAALGGDIGRRRLLLVVLHERADPPRPVTAHAARSLELGPLSQDAIAEIGRLYLPAEAEPLPIQTLAAESRGVPLAVHRVAAEWARARASSVAGASADRAAIERDELRAAEEELSDDLLALRTIDEHGRLYRSEEEGAPLPAVCPFLGLATFDAAHAEYFFGRERLVAELVARLVGAPLLAVIGPSGSGKSSAVRAGLLPALASGVLPGSEGWSRALIRPGAHPLATLEEALPDGGERAVLVVDQFEEVFTVCRDERERTEFLDALVALAEDRDRRVQVVVAMRADFYGHCASHDRLARLVGANQVLVGAMRRDELRRAIVEPARRVGLRVAPSLTDALIVDVLDEPGGLPLLSAALLEQWRERDGRVMRRAAYERTGGVRGAVGRLAEATYAQLSEPERVAAKRILLRLADAEDEAASFVRRRVPLDELEGDGETTAALEVLVDSRLVTADEETVEVAHEALLREWPRLRAWLEEDAEGRRLHQRLIHAARDWEAADRDPGELYRGARLASALDWRSGHENELNPLERQFLDESRAEAEHEAEHQRRTNRRLRVLLAGLAALLAVAVVAGIVALNQRGEARDAARIADAQRLGVEALGEERLDRALLLSRAAVELDESSATQSNLLSVLMRNPATLGIVDYGWGMYGAAISSDGKLLATGDERGGVEVYHTATRLTIGRPYRIEAGLIQNVSFSPDGGTLAVSFLDQTDTQTAMVDLIDPRSHRRRLRLRLPPLRTPADFVFADVAFLPNGRDLLVHPVHSASPDAPPSAVYRINGTTGAVQDQLLVGRFASNFYASQTADRRRIFLTSMRDDRTWEIDSDRLSVVRSWPVGDYAGTVSPDGRVFALASREGRVQLLDLASGQLRPFRGGHDGPVLRMRFTPDGRMLVTTGRDGRLLAWDVEDGTIAHRFAGHTGPIDGLDLTTDGRTLLTASVDTRAILWDLAGDRRLDRRFPVGRRFAVDHTPRGIAVSPDGHTLALTHSDGAVDLIDTRTLRRRATIHAIDGHAASVAFSPDGRLLAVTGKRGQLTLWNARTLAPAGELTGLGNDSQAVAFSPDSKLVAAAEAMVSAEAFFDEDQPLRVWDVRQRALTAFRARTSANLIAFSPNGRLIAAANQSRGTDIRDARTGTLVKRLGPGDRSGEGEFSRSVAFSPDGDLLFVGQYNGTGRLFSTDTWKPVGTPLTAHTARITFPEFTRDGRTLVTAAADGRVVIWDVATQKPIGSPLRLAPKTFVSAALSPDGSRLYAISTRGEGISFNLSPEAWKRHACLVAGRELTEDEWDDALPARPYQAVCSGD